MFSCVRERIIKLLLHSFCFFSIYGAFSVSILDYQAENLMKEYFLNIIYENSFCECGGNDGCTRGCRFDNDLDREQYPPVRRCTGKKSSSRSTDQCAKHVTGAVMAFIHSTLFIHCKSVSGQNSQNLKSYKQCVDTFDEDVQNRNVSICRHGFRFDSAFCFLNLDGQSFDLYDKISHRGIRWVCKNWDFYNQLLLHVDASIYYREPVTIPMFKKIPLEEITSEQNGKRRVDPDKIPIGSIIVSESEYGSPHGHVEVKTHIRKCGKDKLQVCFCSDFCRKRLVYTKPVLAVFEWNPSFIEYVWNVFFLWEEYPL